MTGLALLAFFGVLFGGAYRSRMAYISHATDGDSVRAFHRGKWVSVRVRMIDAPELDQPGGDAAREYLNDLVAGRWVELDRPATERWGRVLAGMKVGRRCVSVAMIKAGQAFAYMAPKRIHALESIAKRARIGVHRLRIVKPWDWRKGKR